MKEVSTIEMRLYLASCQAVLTIQTDFGSDLITKLIKSNSVELGLNVVW